MKKRLGNKKKEIETLNKEFAEQKQTLEQEQEAKQVYQQKTAELETQLLNLAKQKIKTKAKGKEILEDLTAKLEEREALIQEKQTRVSPSPK